MFFGFDFGLLRLLIKICRLICLYSLTGLFWGEGVICSIQGKKTLKYIKISSGKTKVVVFILYVWHFALTKGTDESEKSLVSC